MNDWLICIVYATATVSLAVNGIALVVLWNMMVELQELIEENTLLHSQIEEMIDEEDDEKDGDD